MKIKTKSNRSILVDKEDYERVAKHSWSVDKYGYPRTRITEGSKRKTIRLHRFLMGTDSKLDIDHINGNKLDNRRINLRFCSRSQNSANSKKHSDALYSKFKGVTYEKKKRLWRARIRVAGKLVSLGRHKNELDAANAYDAAAVRYFGSFARLNKDIRR